MKRAKKDPSKMTNAELNSELKKLLKVTVKGVQEITREVCTLAALLHVQVTRVE